MAASMAFFWAVEPSPLSVPEKQAAAAAELPPVAAAPPEPLAPPELLSLPHADRARAPVRATAPAVRTRLVRMSCTGGALVCGGSGRGAMSRLSRPAHPTRTLGGPDDVNPPVGERRVNAGQSLGATRFPPGRTAPQEPVCTPGRRQPGHV